MAGETFAPPAHPSETGPIFCAVQTDEEKFECWRFTPNAGDAFVSQLTP